MIVSMKLFLSANKASWRRVHQHYDKFMSSINYPTHVIVNMPSLSPTMESGTIGKWLCQVGDEIQAGSAIAEIETDKASMTFEAQDEFYIAKLLCDIGQEVKVGQPILITVEDKSFVSAFSSFTLNNTSATASSVEISTPKKIETVIPSTKIPSSQPPLISQPVPSTSTTASVVPTKAIKNESASAPLTKQSTSSSVSSSIPAAVKKHEAKKSTNTDSSNSKVVSKPSPLLAKFRKDQLSYIEKYGRSCHRAIQY